MKSETVEIEIYHYQFEALKKNKMISDMCGQYLKSEKRRGDYFVLVLTIPQAKYLAGWVAAEANHAKSNQESELLNSACDAIELYI